MSLWQAVRDTFNERANFDIVGRRRRWFAVSGVVIAISLASLGTRGVNLGIDFEGGRAWQVSYARGHHPSVASVRSELRPLGLGEARITVVGGQSIRVQARVGSAPKSQQSETNVDAAVRERLAKLAGVQVGDVSSTTVGPTFGAQVSRKALRALIFFLVAVAIYVALRFELKMAGAALVALAHDMAISVGIYSLTGFEVTPATVTAFLTILGYSLYDTVVIFDKVKENTASVGAGSRETYSSVVNRSLNQVLMRSLNTSLTTLIPVVALLVVGGYVLGALTIRDFSLALFIGLLVGTYSSIFTAAPVLAAWKEREPRYRALRARVEGRMASAALERPPAPAGVLDGEAPAGEEAEPAPAGALARPRTPVPVSTSGPRGRKPRGRKRRRR